MSNRSARRGRSFDEAPELSALVLLESVSPQSAAVEALRSEFAQLGFQVGAAVAISFAISGPAELFDRVFPSAAPVADLVEARSTRHGAAGEVFLPVDDLPAGVDASRWAGVSAIFFPEAPDFGPGNP